MGPTYARVFPHRGKPDGPGDHPESPFYKREKPPRYRGVAVARRALLLTLDRKAFIEANLLVKQRLLLQLDADLIISQANAAAVP